MAVELARVGRIVKPHGIRGGVIARPESDGSDVLLHLSSITVDKGGSRRPVKVLRAQWQGKQILLQLEGLADRNAAEALVGADLLVDPALLPEPDAGEYYRDDLVGLVVVGKADGRRYGPVVELESSPMQEWLVVDFEGRQVLVPFTEGFVEVDEENGLILVDPPEGLFEGETVGG